MRPALVVSWALACALLVVSARADELFVSATRGDDAADGLTWSSAKRTVLNAIAAAASTPTPDVINVAEGTYFGSLQIPPDVTLLGGWALDASERHRDFHPSVLDGGGTAPVLLLGTSTDACVIDGFIVRHGLSADPAIGGGATLRGTSAIVRNCVFERNRSQFGAGVFLDVRGQTVMPAVEDCLIRNNRLDAVTDWSDWRLSGGGAAYVIGDLGRQVDCPLRRCIIERNFGPPGWFDSIPYLTGGLILTGDFITHDLIVRRNDGTGVLINNQMPAEMRNLELSDEVLGLQLVLDCTDRANTTLAARMRTSTIANPARRYALIGVGVIGPPDFQELCPSIYFAFEQSVAWGTSTSIRFPTNVMSPPNPSYFPVDVISTTAPLLYGPPNVVLADALHVRGPMGDHYLSHVATGQAIDSPAVDHGSISVTDVGLDGYTTRIDGVPDTGAVDSGFHYWQGPSELLIRRSGRPDSLADLTRVTGLPFTDEPGLLSDHSRPLLFWSVEAALNDIRVTKDVTGNTIRLDW